VRTSWRNDRGSGSVLSLALVATIMCLAGLLFPFTGLLVVHGHAQALSDQAALASADVLSGITVGVPCTVALSLVEPIQKSEWTCLTVGDDAYVSGTVTYGPISFDVKSRAGPPQD
jgi:secretion/DNA translocation related TadE-like protein